MAVELGQGTGPLRGVRVIEIASIGPGPHAATLLADLGADILRVERPGGTASAGPRETDFLTRGRPSVALDVTHSAALDVVLDLVAGADVVLEGMRPGVAERLGIGPDACLARNPRVVYGRMTGWGQTGPLAPSAGHDLDYIAVAGVLHGMGQDPVAPHFPANLVGDFGGGSTYLVIGVLAALLEARISGHGQVVDAAIVDGVAHLNLMWMSVLAGGAGRERRGANLLDGGAPNYAVYETADGRHMAVAALEPQFYRVLLEVLGIDAVEALDPDRMRALLTARFRERTQAEWAQLFDGTDACCVPVLPTTEAVQHPHLRSRGVYVEHGGLLQSAPAPRFSRTSATLSSGPSMPGEHTREGLLGWGVDEARVEALLKSGAAVQT